MPDPRELTLLVTETVPPFTVMAPVKLLLLPRKFASPAPDFTKEPEPDNVPKNCGEPEVVFNVRIELLPIVMAPAPVNAEVVAEALSTRLAPDATERAPEPIVAPVANANVPADTVVEPV